MQLIVGRIVRPHGIRGEVIVDVRTDDPQDRFALGRTLLTRPPKSDRPGAGAAVVAAAGADPPGDRTVGAAADAAGGGGSAELTTDRAEAEPPDALRWTVPDRLTIEAVRPHQSRLIVTFGGVDDRDVAEELRGVLLCVDSAEVSPPDDPDEFHDHQLVGLAAVTPEGEPLGEVVRVDHAPASDLLVLRRPEGGTALIPFVRAIVPTVDLTGGRVVVDPPGGLLDL